MKLNLVILATLAVLASAGCTGVSGNPGVDRVATAPNISTQVLSRSDLEETQEDWGVFVKYFEGETVGTRQVLSGVAEIKPGMEIHPPHTHAEEEYLMITQGSGTWSVNGVLLSANTGDMLYAAPWDEHGLTNTGDTVLSFVFWKWVSKEMQDVPAASE